MMPAARCSSLDGVRVLECDPAGPPIRNASDAVDLIAAASSHAAAWIAIPVARLHPDFFRLKTGMAGEILQKFVTYHLPVVVIGDISSHISESAALRDFVYECNRGREIWFAASAAEFQQRLLTARPVDPATT